MTGKAILKKGMAMLLSAGACLSAFAGGTGKAYAAQTGTVYLVDYPRSGDVNEAHDGSWGRREMTFANGWKCEESPNTTFFAMNSYDGQVCYCIEPGVSLETGDTFQSRGEDFWNSYPSAYNKTISPAAIKTLIGRILTYGYQGKVDASWRSQNSADADKIAHGMATQILVWETVVGERDAQFNHVGKYNVKEVYKPVHPLYARYLAWYDKMVSQIQAHARIPSFMAGTASGAKTVELKWTGSQYQAVLTDTNKVLSGFTFSSNVKGLTFSASGDKLTITAKEAPAGDVSITAVKNAKRAGIVTWTDGKTDPKGGRQDTVSYFQTVNDTVRAYLKAKVTNGNLKIIKTSEDGAVKGISFKISGSGIEKTVTTDDKGEILAGDLPAGSYKVTELSPDRYAEQKEQTVTVKGGQTAAVSFSNVLKKFKVTVTKTDAETGKPQGSAKLSGAVYGIYQDGELVDTYTTDENGQFTTKDYICGDGWTVQEITPSEGYLLNDTSYSVGAETKLYKKEYNTAPETNVKEQVIKGNISIIKHTDNGDTKIETPESGAQFQVYLKEAGSYENAKESERDTLTCDENGYAKSRDLPYGVYTVHQTKSLEGREAVADFDVFISSDGKTYQYLINDALFKSYLKVVKTDAETGKVIPLAGTGFQILRPDGSKVEMSVTYPQAGRIDTFYTDENGMLITPEKLEYGKGYSLVEVSAPYGYVLNPEPVKFDVTADTASEEDAVQIVAVKAGNAPQKGIINISKSGEVFATVKENGGVYQPVYETCGLSGAVYEIRAAEDIVTPDGTRHYAAGEVVDTVTTGDEGTAESKPLYLGRYDITETKAPQGMVLDAEKKTAELSYAGQEVKVTEASQSLTDVRQKAKVSMAKTLETNETFGIGRNGEISAVTFGLYAAKEIKAADGSTIPEGGLIETLSVGENGSADVQTDLPFGSYYLQETGNDDHYLLDGSKYPFEFTYAGENTATVELKVNGGEPVVNKLIYGRVKGLKKTEDGNELAGAQFGLFKEESEEPVMTAQSAEDGSFSFEKIPYGEYFVKETKAPEGYALDTKEYPVSIGGAGAEVDLEITDEKIRGNVQLTKVDKDYPDHHLSGAVFEVYQDGKPVGTMKELPGGVYEMDDLLYGDYTLKETKAPEGFYPDTNTYKFSIYENGKTVIVENEAGKGFINKARTGSLRIEKTSEDGVKKGFTFKVVGKDSCGNAFSRTYTTDKNGQIQIEGLRVGDYTVSEQAGDNTKKYVLPDARKVTIREGKTTVAKFYNKLRPDTPAVPYTGDDTDMRLWAAVAMAAIAGAGAAAACLVRSRKKKEAE